ncbi:MAG: hypothetical protein K8Q99_02035 [Acholeplasmataceae bacterium]|nr:hypothetical protein [Acholeplasmataceae bacterium]MCD4826545.1 hypothetical protein [Acholeplasmataceae bacterium]
MTLEMIRKKVLAEMELYPTFGYIRIYTFVYNHVCNMDENLTDSFMLSNHVKLTIQELKKVKLLAFRNYKKNLKA